MGHGREKLSRKKKKKSKPDGSSEVVWCVRSLELPSKTPWVGLGIQFRGRAPAEYLACAGFSSQHHKTTTNLQPGWFNKIYFLTLRGWESKLKARAGLAPLSRAGRLHLLTMSSCCPSAQPTVVSHLCTQTPSSYSNTTLTGHFNLITYLKALPSDHILRFWQLGLQHKNLGNTIQHITSGHSQEENVT